MGAGGVWLAMVWEEIHTPPITPQDWLTLCSRFMFLSLFLAVRHSVVDVVDDAEMGPSSGAHLYNTSA